MVSTQKGQCTIVLSPPSPNTLNVQGDAQNRPRRWGPRLHGETLKVWSLDLQGDQGRTLRENLTQLPTQNNFPQFLVPGRGHLPGSQLPPASSQPQEREGKTGSGIPPLEMQTWGLAFQSPPFKCKSGRSRGVTRSPGAAAWLLGRGAPEGGGKREKEPAGRRSAGGGLSSAFLPIHKDAVTRVGREAHELREPAAQQTNSPEAQSASAPSLPDSFQRRLLPGGRSPGEAGSAARPRPQRAAASARGSSRGVPGPPLSPRPRQGGEGRPKDRSARP